ncbi:FAD-dependent oxidoreductase, partial [Microbacterium sp. S16(2024)]
GAATAWELIKDGHAVTQIEPSEPGGPQAASYGNGAWISPASIVPMSMPGLWRKVPGYLLDPNGPLVLRWAALPSLAPWLLRFLMAGWTARKVERTAHLLASILRDGPQRHAILAEEIGRPDYIRQTGLLYAYRDRNAFAEEALAWR